MISAEALQPFLQAGLGLLLGSFIGLVSVRLPANEPWAWTRSKCRSCGSVLSPLELVPLAGWLYQGGRHLRCGSRISIRYPLLELSAAAIGAGAAWLAPGLPGLLGAVFGWQLLLIGLVDAEHLWLPDHFTLPLALTGMGAALLEPQALASRLAGGVVGFGALAALSWAYRRFRGRDGMGSGDPLLAGGLGSWLGLESIPTLMLTASLLGLGWGLILQRGRGRDPETLQLPFGTFLATAAACVWIFDNVMRLPPGGY